MDDYDPPSPHETIPTGAVSGATPGQTVTGSSGDPGSAPPPPASSPDLSTPVIMSERVRRPWVRRLISNRRIRWIVAVALACSVIGVSVGLAASSSATAPSPPATPGHSVSGSIAAGGAGSGGGSSNARSGPAAGGAAGTVGNVSTTSFTMTTSAGQDVTINEVPSTVYTSETGPTAASAITKGESVLVLGTTSGTTIAATQIVLQPTSGGSVGSATAKVVPFQRGAPTTSEQVGQIPANWSQGSGTIVSGSAANQATEAALAAYPGGIVDRVVKLSNGEYNVHYIGVNWPHHIFVNQDFEVVGAE